MPAIAARAKTKTATPRTTPRTTTRATRRKGQSAVRGQPQAQVHDAHVVAWLAYCNGLAEQWRHLAEWWVGRQWGSHEHDNYRDELLAACRLGIVRASRRYDAGRKVAFSTYATLWMRKEIGEYLRQCACTIRVPITAENREEHVERVRCLSLDFWRGGNWDEEGNNQQYSRHGVHHADRRDIHEERRAEVAEQIELGMQALDSRLREVIRLRHVERMTLAQAGLLLGVTRERVRQLEADALAKMRRAIERQDEDEEQDEDETEED